MKILKKHKIGYISLSHNEGNKTDVEYHPVNSTDNNSKEDSLGKKIIVNIEKTKQIIPETFDEVIVPKEKVNKDKIENIYKIIKFILSSLLFFGWITLYILSLFSCNKSQAECLEMLTQDTAVIIAIEIFFSAFIFVTMSILSYLKIIYRLFLFISIPIMMFLFYVYDTGADLSSHGSYNRAFFYLFVIISSIGLIVLYFFIKLLIKHTKKTIFTIVSLTITFYFLIRNKIANSCEYFDKGFKQTIVSKDSYCNLPKPKTCFLKYTSNFWDVSKIRGMSCRNERSRDEYELLNWSNKTDLKRIGFPRTENWHHFPDSILSKFNKNIFANMVDMDKDKEKAKTTEVYIDYSKNLPEVVIDIKKNDTLINQRKKIYEDKKDKTMFKNILYIYIDSISRNMFRRKMKKTFKWLEKHYQNKNSKHSSYQFLKYHALNYYTYANMIPGYFGVHKFEGKGKYFLYKAKETGYITGQSYDVCCRETWDLEMAYEPYLNYTNFDHEFNGFYCDPHFSDPEKPYGALKGAYSVVRKCMYGKDAGEHQIEYAKQFFDTYKDQPKFFRLAFLDAHEGTGEVIKYMDDPILDFLKYLEINGHLNDTLIQIQSDHGMSMPGPIYIIKPIDYYYEVYLPTLFYVIPSNHKNFEILNQNLLENENKFITPFDTHAGLINLFDKDSTKTQFGVSLFSNIVDDKNQDRTCKAYKIETQRCMCNYGKS